jgi:hypothetical protein
MDQSHTGLAEVKEFIGKLVEACNKLNIVVDNSRVTAHELNSITMPKESYDELCKYLS